jgi:hypothetical protein
MAEDL